MNDTERFHGIAESWGHVFQTKVETVQQGWFVAQQGVDVVNQPLKVAGKEYENGFGVHADSRIRIHARKPLVRLQILGGIAENTYTLKQKDSIDPMIFSVEEGGKVLQEQQVVFGETAEFDLPLNRVTTFDLVIRSSTGSITAAHVNWVMPYVTAEDGEKICLSSAAFPVRFRYGDENEEQFISSNGIRHTVTEEKNYFRHEYISECETLRMILTCKAYREFPALEYHLAFENPSGKRSERLSGVRSLNMTCPAAIAQLLRHHGAFHRENEIYTWHAFRDSFRPVLWTPSRSGEAIHFGGIGGRSSVDWMPYFDIPDGENNWRVAIGWSGQWNTNVVWDGMSFRIDAGIETFDAVLESGEHLEFPSVILQRNTEGGREKAVNLWRRFVTKEIMLPVNGKPPVMPVTSGTWGGRKEAEHLEKIRKIQEEKLDINVYWIDAGWFGPESEDTFGEWGAHVGDWKFNPVTYPNELREISKRCHENGLKLLLWFEQERVMMHTQLAKEHPEYLISIGPGSALLNLGNPEAWQYAFDTLCRIIDGNQLDWYREDFNFSPLPYWKQNDTEDRQGITEVLYVNGLYRYWRELRKKYPHLLIDNCASGGRRLDFELLRYSVPLWYSDLQCWPSFDPQYSLTQIAGLNDYLPRFSGGIPDEKGGDTYNFRAGITNGLNVDYNGTKRFDAAAYPHQWLRERIAEYKQFQDCYAGDFYELIPPVPEEKSWCVLQYDLPEEERGLITVFRGKECPVTECFITPRGLVAEKEYLVFDTDHSFEPFTISGENWMKNGFALRIEQARTARMIQYKFQS